MLHAISDNFDIQRRAILTLINRIAEKDKIANPIMERYWKVVKELSANKLTI